MRRTAFALMVVLSSCSSSDPGGSSGATPSDGGTTAQDGGAAVDGSTVVGDDAGGGTDARAANDGAGSGDGSPGLPDAGVTLPPINPSPCGGKIHCVRPGDDLQAVLTAAASGDTVQVAEGMFSGNFSIAGKSLLLAGGFDTTFAMRDATARVTKLDGGAKASVLTVTADGFTVRVDGFTITNGAGDPQNLRSGAGINCGLGNVTISFNHIVGNVVGSTNIDLTGTRGGGVLANGNGQSVVSIVANVIENNVSGRGAGVASSDVGTLLLDGNVIKNNRGYSDHGGGVFVNSPNATLHANWIEGNEIGPAVNPYGLAGGVYIHEQGTVAHLSYNTYTKNKAPSSGSGFFVDNAASATLDHELFYANACNDKSGAAMLVDATDGANPIGSTLTVTNTTVADHPCHSTYDGNGIMVVGLGSTATVSSSIFWNNGPNQFATALSGTPANVSTTFTSADPMFVDPANGDYHLKPGSPAAGFGRY